VQPAIEDALAKPPFLAQLGGGDAPLLGPLVDGLRLEPKVWSDFFEGEDLAIGRVRTAHGPSTRPLSGPAPRLTSSSLRSSLRGVAGGSAALPFASPRESFCSE